MVQKWGKGGTVIVVATALFVISLFMPWVDAGFLSASGFQQEGYLILILFAYPIYTALAEKPINLIGGLISSVLAVVVVVMFMFSKSVDFFGSSTNLSGTGMYLAIIASIILVIGVFMKSKEN